MVRFAVFSFGCFLRLGALVGVGVFAAAPVVAGGDTHRQLGAHEHGRGVLNLAVEGTRVSGELEISAFDILGFGHAPRSDDDRAKRAKSKVVLLDSLKLFGPSAAAGCQTSSSSVVFTADEDKADKDHDGGSGDHHDGGSGDHHDGGAEDHDGAHHDGAHHDEKATSGGDGEEGGGHSDVHVTFEFECRAPAKLEAFSLTFFEAFPRASSLTVNGTTSGGQFKVDVSRAQPIISIVGASNN